MPYMLTKDVDSIIATPTSELEMMLPNPLREEDSTILPYPIDLDIVKQVVKQMNKL